MSADNLNKWLTLLANIGVVIGLVLLIYEIRQNSELVRAQIHQARSDVYSTQRQDFANSEFLLPAYEKYRAAGGHSGEDALAALDPIEAARVYRYLQSRAGDYDNLFYQYRQGLIDEAFYHSRVESSVRRLAPVWIRLGLHEPLTPEFKAEVERLAADAE